MKRNNCSLKVKGPMFVKAFSAEDDPYKKIWTNISEIIHGLSLLVMGTKRSPLWAHSFRLSLACWPLGVNSVTAHLHLVEVVCNEKWNVCSPAGACPLPALRWPFHQTVAIYSCCFAALSTLTSPLEWETQYRHLAICWSAAHSIGKRLIVLKAGLWLEGATCVTLNNKPTAFHYWRCWGDWISQLANVTNRSAPI